MKKSKIIPRRQTNTFSLEARQRWNTIPESIQKKILDNIWCSKCSGTATIILESAKMERDGLILRGKCIACGQEVCRFVEPEN